MPANGRFLLDTNVIIALLEGDDAVLSNLDLAPEVFVLAVALGESVLRSREVWPSVREHCQGAAVRIRQGHCLSRFRCCTGIRETKTVPEEERAAPSLSLI